MKARWALCAVSVVAALSGCSGEDPTSAVPAPPAQPSIEPVGARVVQAELRRAATAMDDHRRAEGAFTSDPNALAEHGFVSSDVLVLVPYADGDRYCIEAASSTDPGIVFSASDAAPEPRQGHCTER